MAESKQKAPVGNDPDIRNTATSEESGNKYETVKVKVSRKVLDNTNGLGAYYDAETKQTIGKDAVSVPATEFVNALLRNQELVKA